MTECIVFALDIDQELGQEVGAGSGVRLDVMRHACNMFAHAKKQVNPRHCFALCVLRDTAQLLLPPTTSTDSLAAALTALQPSTSPCATFELGSLITVTQQVEQHLAAQASASARGQPAPTVRVLLLFGRSRQVPVWHVGRGGRGLALDCLYIHEKPQPGVNCPQECFSVLEDEGDALARAAGHHAYIFEASATNVRKWLGLVVWLLAHPAQRLAQQDLALAPVDLAAVVGARGSGTLAAGSGA